MDFTIITKTGLNKLIQSVSEGTRINLTKMAVGDGSGEINQDMQSLENERHRFSINAITQSPEDPNVLEVEGVIAANVGGFYIREAGIFCDDDTLFAVAKFGETYKPLLSEGSSKDITINFKIQVSNNANIALKVDNNVVLATRKWVISDFYNKSQSDERFLGINAKAKDSDLLDGLDSAAFVKKDDFSKNQKRLTLLSGDGNVVIDLNEARYFKLLVDKNITLSVINEPDDEVCVYFLELTDAGNFSITWQGQIKWNKNRAPSFSRSKKDIIGFLKTDELMGFIVGKDINR